MSKATLIGWMLPSMFPRVRCGQHGQTAFSRKPKRDKLLDLLPGAPALLGCAGSMCWKRELRAMGHAVRLIPATNVKSFVKRHKNDAVGAWAVAPISVASSIAAGCSARCRKASTTDV